jgi:type IV pilus assembly protein PilW
MMHKPFPNTQSGYTVVELLIAATLGLVLLAGVGQLFVGSNQSFRLQRQLADVQDSGRFGLNFMRDEIERGGWSNGTEVPKPSPILFAPSEFSTGDLCPDDDCTLDGGDDVSDAVTIAYQGDTDCAGSAAPSGEVENRFFVGGDDGRQLLCQGNGGAVAQPLVANVDAMQIVYGIDVANNDKIPDQYVPFDRIPTDADGTPRVGDIVSIRISLLIAGEQNTSIPKQNRDYQVGDRQYEFDDQTPRRVFSITAAVRNPHLSTEATGA